MKVRIMKVTDFNRITKSEIIKFKYHGEERKHGYVRSTFYNEGGIAHSFYKTKHEALSE